MYHEFIKKGKYSFKLSRYLSLNPPASTHPQQRHRGLGSDLGGSPGPFKSKAPF